MLKKLSETSSNNYKLLTGGSGLLGQELQKLDKFFAPPHRVFDVTKATVGPDVDMVIHAAGYTNVVGAETNKMECFDTNVRGTLNLLNLYPNTPFVYISSEYAKNPINFYAVTKSLSEQLVMNHPNYLIIRTLFKKRPWKYEYAFRDQYTLGSYVDDIAPKIIKAINEWDGRSKLIYIGHGGRKTMYQLAKETRIDVIPNLTTDIKSVKIPTDYK